MANTSTWDNIKSGLTEGLGQVFPVIGKDRELHLEDVEIKDNRDAGDYAAQKQAILNKSNWNVPVYGTLVLKDKGGKVLEKRKTRLLSIPKLTNRNTIIYNGTEYSIANQLRLRPGVYTTTGDDGVTRSQFNVGKGANFDVWQDPANGIFYMQFDQSSVPLYPVLKDIGVSDEEIAARWGKEILDSNKQVTTVKYKNAVVKAYKKMTYSEDDVSYDDAKAKLKDVLSKAILDPLVTKATLKKEHSNITPDVLLGASRKVLKINRAEEQPDDRESLVYKAVHGPDDFIRESITKGSRPVLGKVKSRLNSMYGEGIKQIFAPGTLSLPIYTNINASPLVSVAQDANPLGLMEAANRITSFGPGGITNTYAIPEAVRNIHPSQIGFIDPVRTPESDKAGIDLQLSIGAKKDKNTLTIKLKDRNGEDVRKPLTELQGKVVALPGQQGKLKVEAIKDGKLVTVSKTDVDYSMSGPNRMFSNSTVLVPFLSNNAGARANLAGKMGVQALSLKYREKPLVQTAADIEGRTNEDVIGEKITQRSPVSGEVTKVTDKAVEITDKSGKKHVVNLYQNYIIGSKNFLHNEPSVAKGDKVEAGQLLADSNYTKDGVLAMGTNLKTIYVPYKGLSVSGDTMVLWTDKDSAGHFTPIREIPLSAGIKANALDTNDLVPRLHDIHSFIGHYTDDEMTEVLTVDGIAVKATESHSFITINDDGDLREIAPKDMVPGKTLLPVARPQLPLSDSVRIIELNPFENGGRTVTIPLSWDIGFLFGMYTVGGMAIGSNKGPKGIRIVITDDEVINKVRQTLMSLGVLFKHHTRTGGDGVGGILRSYNTALAKFLAKNCGSVAENKKIPDILWSSNPEFINGFISGYWSGDRTTKSPAMTATISKELAEGICFLLASIGVRATYSTHNKTPYLKQYLVTVLPHSLSKFPDIFLKRKNEALLELKAKPVEQSIDRVPVPAKDRKVIEEALGISAIDDKSYVGRELLLKALARGADISSRLKLLIHSNVWWDVVESVKKIEFENYVYDLDMRPIANFVVGPGLVVHNTFEDGIVVSESASQKLTSQHMYRFDLPVDDLVSLSKDKWLAYFANKAEPSQIGKLDASGVIKPGTPVTKGDYLIAAMRLGEASPEDAMLGKLSRRLAKPYKDISVQWEKDNDGHVVDVVINPKNITVTVRMDASLVVGDKITNREGGKGVVTSVLPDSEMPKDKDGNAYDVILNPATVMSRMNIGQLLETAASKVSTEDKPYVAPLFPEKDENISKDVKKLLEKKQIKETDIVYDPSGKEVGEIFAGKQYFYKLGKTTDTNYSARAFSGKYDADMAPLRGGEEGAKGIGLLDMYALLSHNARNILRESVTSKAENNPEFFKALQLGRPLPPPKPTFAFEKFVNYLKGSGVNVDKRGDRFKLLPLTDKDVERLSSGKIEDATMLKAKDMSEEEGGLFDFNKTGGRLGNKWSHIELAEQVLNPIFIEPARRLLGLKEKELLDIQVNQGGKAIQEMLSKINVDQRLKELNSSVDKLNGTAKDDAIKQIKYLRVLKDANMSPAEAYTIQKVPVIPPIFRPVYPVGSGGETRVSDVNNLYKQVILVSRGLGSDVFKNLPEEEKASSRRELFNTVKALQGLDKSVSGKDYKGFVMSIKGNTPKEGLFQSKLLKKQQDIAGRATIGGDPSLGLDEIKMPEDMAWTLYGPFIIRELVKLGMKLMDAKKEVEERTDKAKEMLLLAMNERPVLLNRAPTLHKFNIMAFKPMPYKGKTLLIPPMVMKPFGADVDGDCVTNSVYYTYDTKEGDVMPFGEGAKIRHKYGVVNLKDFPRTELIGGKDNKEVYRVPGNIKVLTVWNGKEEWLTPESFSVHKNLKMNEVVTNTSRTIQCSDDHSLITVDDNLGYVKNKAVIGMTIPRLRKPVGDNIEVVKEIDLSDIKNGRYKFADKISADFNFGYFTGAFIGNGWINNYEKKKTAICFASMVEPVVDFIGGVINSYCDEKVHNSSVSSTHKSFDNKEIFHTKHTWYSNRLARYLEENIGSGAENKHLPLFWMHTDEDFRWGLLSGLIDTDGSVSINAAMRTRKTIQYTMGYTTVSRRLAYEIVALAHTLNLTASVVFLQTPKGDECYDARFTQESIEIMQSRLLLNNPDRKKRLSCFKPNKDYKRNKYTPKLSIQRLEELRSSIGSPWIKKHHTYTKEELGEIKKRRSLYSVVYRVEKGNSALTRQTALGIFDLDLGIFRDDEFWLKWKNMVLDESVEWEIITEIRLLPFITEAYDLTIPPVYTMVTESGIVVQDTMTVHVPVTEESRREALNKMLPSQNLFSVLDKSPHYAPSNEAIFGLYIGTKPRSGSPLKTYQTEKEVVRDLDAGKIQPTDVINYGKAKTTAGAVGVNAILPDELKDYSRTLTKKTLSDVLKTIGQKYPTEYTRVAKGLKALGDKWAFSPEASLSFKDFELPDVRDKMFAGAKTSLLKFPGRKIKDVDVIDVYSKVQDELIPQLMEEGKRRDNKFYEWSASGSRGSPVQFSSIWGAPVLVTDLQNKTIPSPIKRNFIEGLTPGEYFTSLYGTRKGITATKLSVTEPGAMAKEIVASNVDLVVTTLDCGTRNGLEMDVSSRDALDRLLATDVVGSGKLIARRNSIVTSRLMDVLKNNGVSTIKVRSSITCEAPKGVCASCVGIQENGKLPEIGENIGVKHSMSITEPLTQIALSTKHTAGIGTKGSGVSRLKSILEMPQSEYTKEVLARQDGVIDEVKKLPTGGHKVVVTSGSTQEEYVIPPGLNLIKTEGKVVKGEPLSGGLPNIRDYVSIKGIEAGRSRLADTIKGFYRESGKDIDRRIPETIARGTLNFAKIVSPGDFDLVPGNIVEYNQVAPLKTKRIVPLNPVNAVGYKLANPYGGYERGTRVDAGVAKTLARSKVKRVNVYKEPVVVEPVAIGINKIPVVKNDWLGRMGFRYIANTIREGAATGAEANIHSLNPIPALSYGAEFGKGMSVDVY